MEQKISNYTLKPSEWIATWKTLTKYILSTFICISNSGAENFQHILDENFLCHVEKCSLRIILIVKSKIADRMTILLWIKSSFIQLNIKLKSIQNFRLFINHKIL